MDRKNISSAFQWMAVFLINSFYMHVRNNRVNICGCLVPDETVHPAESAKVIFEIKVCQSQW